MELILCTGNVGINTFYLVPHRFAQVLGVVSCSAENHCVNWSELPQGTDHDRLHESRGGILGRIDAAKFRLRSEQHKVVRTGYEAFGANRSVPTADCRTTRRHRRDTLKHARAIL